LEHDVAVPRDAGDERAAARVTKVDRDRALVPRERGPPEAAPVDALAPGAHRIARSRRLDLHDVGTEVAEQLPRERARDEAPELEDAQARERSGRGHFVGGRHRGKIPTRPRRRPMAESRAPRTTIGRYDNPYSVAVWSRPPPAGTRCEPMLLE